LCVESVIAHVSQTGEAELAYGPELNAIGVEAAWRLGKWDSLDQFLSRDCTSSFDVDVGKLLLCVHNRNTMYFESTAETVYSSLMGPLAAASSESFERSYNFLIKLHILWEIESAFKYFNSEYSSEQQRKIAFDHLLKSWDSRLKLTSPSYKVRESILSIRRHLLLEERFGHLIMCLCIHNFLMFLGLQTVLSLWNDV
jgi:serine/threonine-protein kinase ATR